MIRKLASFLISLFIALSLLSQQKIRFEISALPSNTPGKSAVFLAGNFNSWDPQNEKFRFKEIGNKFFLELLLQPGDYEFKVTRGSWEDVECSGEGRDISNRSIKIVSDTTVQLSVIGWKDFYACPVRVSTAGKNVHIIDTAFLVPELNRKRRIWIYLPPDYGSSTKTYPVLYMQDGQNLFDAATSYAGEWAIDEKLDSLFRVNGISCIVVGIDNGGSKRLSEYSPFDFKLPAASADSVFVKGEGDLYIRFLVDDLKPFVDQRYRTMKDKANTWIAGSSMGGLISMCAILEYPGIFGGAGIFSPSFLVIPGLKSFVKQRAAKASGKIYFVCGSREDELLKKEMLDVYDIMKKGSHSDLFLKVDPGARHHESSWAKQFPDFFKWIYYKNRK